MNKFTMAVLLFILFAASTFGSAMIAFLVTTAKGKKEADQKEQTQEEGDEEKNED
ncbi:MAG: hypothetical protein Q4C60_11390 [Eubacteriales bacterium]|nr:hypothetical protein [Eubacteriales bacterium]